MFDERLTNKINELRGYRAEREWFEFKENWFEPTQLGEYISAISNAAAYEGQKMGYFIWGIHDNTHEITGTDFDQDQEMGREPLKHWLRRQLSPDIEFRFEEGEIEEKRVVALLIPAAKIVPTSFRQERYIRIGSSKENLRKYPEKESYLFEVLHHGLPTIENTPSQYQDLTFEKLLIYYGAKGLKLNPDTYQKNLGLLMDDGRYNLLAQLLSDNSHLPIRVAIFSGKTKADRMYSVREFGFQCILYSLDEVLRYGDVLNIIQADETDRVVERKEVPLFESDAFREAIINAFVHNAWVSGNEPMITVYSDRIEILSRGTLPPSQTMEGFFAGESVPVNPKLSEILLQLHISEKTGRGVPKITERYGKGAFEFRENAIVVTIPFHWINVMGDKPGDKLGDKPGDKLGDKPGDKLGDKSSHTRDRALPFLTETQVGVLAALRDNPNLTKPQMVTMLHRSKTTIDNAIRALREHGLIIRIGSNKTGYWQVADHQGTES